MMLKNKVAVIYGPEAGSAALWHGHLQTREPRFFSPEHTAAGANLRFVITNCPGRASEVFAFYNDRGECENRIEEFKNGFRADRSSCHRFRTNAFRLLLHGFAHNLVNLFRLQLPQPWRSAQIETLRARLLKLGARVRQTARCIRIHLAAAGLGNLCSVTWRWPLTPGYGSIPAKLKCS